ncbi:MAG: PaaI family thioesterase [Acidimicrobiales bacterium]
MPTPSPPEPDDLRLFPTGRHDIHELLDVEVVEAGPERVVLSLPVTWKVHQPHGILHGGVSALLAESAASFGGALAAGPGRRVVGIELNASHLRSVQDGNLTATATPLRVGRTVQVWSIAVSDDEGRAVCAARCTLAVLSPPAVAEEPARPPRE